jgi:aspartyl-tRNA(Asn)/glutamyl-tRNA(Gln) amidotransferase subunit C
VSSGFVSEEDVRKIAALAKLAPDPEAIHRLTEELNGILGHVRVLERLEDSSAGEGGVSDGPSVFRDPDLGPDPLGAGAPERLAPAWQDGFFLVPRLPALDEGPRGGSA